MVESSTWLDVENRPAVLTMADHTGAATLGPADNAPTIAVRDVVDPDAGIRVRVGGNVRCRPLAADNSGNRGLVGWARLVLARAAAGRRPGKLRLQVAVCIAAIRRAAGRYDIWGSGRPDRS